MQTTNGLTMPSADHYSGYHGHVEAKYFNATVVHPRDWSRQNVREWLKWCEQEYCLSDIPFDRFEMNGKALYMLAKEDFRQRMPKTGDVLYNSLQQYLLGGTNPCTAVKPEVNTSPPPVLQILPHSPIGGTVGETFPSPTRIIGSGTILSSPQILTPSVIVGNGNAFFQDTHIVQAPPAHYHARNNVHRPWLHLQIPGPETQSAYRHPMSSDHPRPMNDGHPISPNVFTPDVYCNINVHNGQIGGNVKEYSDRVDVQTVPFNPAEGRLILPNTPERLAEKHVPVPPKKRPRITSPQCDTGPALPLADDHNNPSELARDPAVSSTSQPKFTAETKLLWEFIKSLLDDPATYRDCICWEDSDNWVFRIVNPPGLAQLWGSEKKKSSMNYEKLSRALRYYYKMNIIGKVPGRRLTYRYLKAPGCIQKGQRGAKPGVPHKRRNKDKDGKTIIKQHQKKTTDSGTTKQATTTNIPSSTVTNPDMNMNTQSQEDMHCDMQPSSYLHIPELRPEEAMTLSDVTQEPPQLLYYPNEEESSSDSNPTLDLRLHRA